MTIAQVSKLYDISPDTLRYYERIGLIPPVTRKANGIRDYQEEDTKWVEFSKCMRSAGLPIEALIDYIALYQQGPETAGAREALLREQRDLLRERIEEMQETLERLNGKVARYENGDYSRLEP